MPLCLPTAHAPTRALGIWRLWLPSSSVSEGLTDTVPDTGEVGIHYLLHLDQAPAPAHRVVSQDWPGLGEGPSSCRANTKHPAQFTRRLGLDCLKSVPQFQSL